MFPTDAKLLNRARERLVRLAKKLGLSLRQSYRRVGKLALIKHQRYAHAHQFKRANRSLRKLKNLSRADRSQHRAGTKPVVGISMGDPTRLCCRGPGGLGLMCQSRVQRRTPSVRILAKNGAYYNEYGFIGVGPGGVSIGPRPHCRTVTTHDRTGQPHDHAQGALSPSRAEIVLIALP